MYHKGLWYSIPQEFLLLLKKNNKSSFDSSIHSKHFYLALYTDLFHLLKGINSKRTETQQTKITKSTLRVEIEKKRVCSKTVYH